MHPALAPAGSGRAPRQLHGLARLFFAVLIARAACDPLFDAIKPDASAVMGPGAAVNAFMLLVAALYFLRRPRRTARIIVPMWGLFMLAAVVSTASAPAFSNAFRLFLVQLSYCAVFAIPFYLVRSDADVRRCLHAILWSSLLPAGYALVVLGIQGGVPPGDEYRLKSTFTHANIFAFYLVLIMAVILYLQKAGCSALSRPARRGLWLYMLLLMALLVCTKTRSAWGAALLIFGLYGLLFERKFLLYALLVPALLLLDPAVRERLTDLGNNDDTVGATNLNSYAWRVLLWKAGLGWMDGSHALLGYGLDSFRHYSPRFFPLEGRDTWDPHNVYVQLYFETGLTGLLAYGWLFWRLLCHLKRGAAHDKAGTTVLVAVVLAYLLTSYSDNMLYYLAFNWYFWFFVGTACAALSARARPVAQASAGMHPSESLACATRTA